MAIARKSQDKNLHPLITAGVFLTLKTPRRRQLNHHQICLKKKINLPPCKRVAHHPLENQGAFA